MHRRDLYPQTQEVSGRPLVSAPSH